MTFVEFSDSPDSAVEAAYEYIDGESESSEHYNIEEENPKKLRLTWTETQPDEPEEFDLTNVDSTNRTTTELRETVVRESQIREEAKERGIVEEE